MGQVSKYLRRSSDGAYLHWCPACQEVHQLPSNGWTFDGNVDCPTYTPSFKHWWTNHATTPPTTQICHYTLTAGVLHFYADSTHTTRGAIPLPELPPELCDPCDWSDG